MEADRVSEFKQRKRVIVICGSRPALVPNNNEIRHDNAEAKKEALPKSKVQKEGKAQA